MIKKLSVLCCCFERFLLLHIAGPRARAAIGVHVILVQDTYTRLEFSFALVVLLSQEASLAPFV